MNLTQLVEKQKKFFYTGKAKEISFRLKSLEKLANAIERFEQDLLAALKKDLNKSEYEAYVVEIMVLKEEIKVMRRNVEKWSRPRKVKTPLILFGAQSFIYPEPVGVNLIIGPWNYPVLLLINPLIGAIAAGNCAVIKPSEHTFYTAKALKLMIEDIFDPDYVAVAEGDIETGKALLAQPFDHIFFTGSVAVGKQVMEKASRALIPVTLELGGKSPVIVTEDANLKLAARRIVWGKFINAGQTCVAPDYVYVPEKIKDELLQRMKQEVERFYGDKPLANPDYTRIISWKHFSRLKSLLKTSHIVFGGESDHYTLKIEPTVIDQVTWEDPIMQEEIFGPLLPVLTYTRLDDVISCLRKKPKPLALYIFTENREAEEKSDCLIAIWRRMRQ